MEESESIDSPSMDSRRTSKESIKDDLRTKSDEEVFAKTLQSKSTRRRSSFPLISVSTESDESVETVSLCDGSVMRSSPAMASSMGALPDVKTHFPLRNKFLQVPKTHADLGSTLSIASHRLVRPPCTTRTQPEESKLTSKPKRKWYQLLQQSSVQFGLDFCYSTEGALVTPILLQLGLPDHLYGLAWILAPVLGLILAPLIGSASDRCYSPMGQRRPFILSLGICVMIGTALYLNSADLGVLISKDDANTATMWGIAITVIGVALTDFSADACGSPFKAYLMDTCNLDDLKRALGMRSTLGGIGGGLGYICIAIDWEQTVFGQALGSQLRVIFLLNITMLLISFILTLTSVPEVPLRRFSSRSESETKYIPCSDEESDGTSDKSLDTNQGKVLKFWCFIKWFYRKRPTEDISLESSERTSLSCDEIDEGSPHCDEERPHKHNKTYAKLKKHRISKGQCRSSDGKPANNGGGSNRSFVPKKKAKSPSKKSEAGSLAGSNCILKINPSDDTKDFLNSQAKMPAGSFNHDATMHQCNDSSQSLAICISNPSVEINCGDDEEGGESDDDDDNKGEPVSILQLLRSTIHMPKELRYLSLVNFLGWASIIILICFFTDFVAQAVYHGDPSAEPGTEEYRLYEEGVKMGSWGLCVYSFVSFALGLVMTTIQRYFSQKFIFVTGHFILAVSCGAMALFTNHPHAILFLCSGQGIAIVIQMTIPYNVLGIYHKSEKFKNPPGGLPRGLGTDMACIDIQVFLSQIIVSAALGPLIQLTGSHISIVVSAAIMSFLASLCAAFLVTYELKDV
ncbi:membrane-associated transporter protein-like [Lytechinus variegatus]|uniref:membrane-associated transporter protein-like n=1 Tax=Lytechinus variegatus TaxID=7654 RepID=UPI001BB1BACF|nr:membrane-associated transporter protein-like [Lytechinus variegatus]